MASLMSKAKARKRIATANVKQQQSLTAVATGKPIAASFPVLKLPAELRNFVYDHVAANDIVNIVKDGIRDSSGVLEVHSKLHNEYLPILLAKVPTIQACIYNFDFSGVVAFLERLSTSELNALYTAIKAKKSRILRQWLNDKDWILEDGTFVSTSYQIFGFMKRPYPRTARKDLWIKGSKLRVWTDVIDRCMESADDATAKEEAEKIQAAFAEYR